jgi:hypothetical protein
LEENSSILITPKLERLIVKKMEYYLYSFVEFPFQSLSFGNSLKYLHVIFPYTCSDSSYMFFINNLIKAQISFHTMIFEMEKGMKIIEKLFRFLKINLLRFILYRI